ncbi:MAG TPA: hypothetical protein PLX41_11345 [Bacteroidales bacterium]|nr:hypothetical protein [Bacteroidales bacterium]
MSRVVEEAVISVNGYIRRIRELSERHPDREVFTSLTLFNNRVTPVWSMLPPDQTREIDFSDFRPEGSSALFDAIGKTVNSLKQVIGEELEANEASAVIVIFTGGYDNASGLFSQNQISSMIHELELKERITFSWFGSTLDTVDVAMALSINRKNAVRIDLGSGDLEENLTGFVDSSFNDEQK